MKENLIKLEKMHEYLDVVSVVLIVLDIKGNIVFINKRGSEILESTKEELLGTNWFDNFIPAELRLEVRRVFEKLIQGKMPGVKHFENYIKTKSGDKKLIAWDNSVLKGKDGKIVGTIASGEDITEKRKIHRELESVSRFPSENTSPVLRVSGKGIIIYANEASKCLFKDNKISVNKLLYRSLREIVLSSLRDNEKKHVEIKCNGEIFLFEIIPIKELDYVNLYGLDISKQKDAEEELKRLNHELELRVEERTRELDISNKKYLALFEQAADSVSISDIKTGKFLEFNENAYRNLGYTKEEFAKLNIADIDVREDIEGVRRHVKIILEKGGDNFESEHRKKNGEVMDVLVSAKIIEIGGKKYQQSIWKDITEIKKIERELVKANKKLKELDIEKSDFLNSISHELKTPLTAMMAHLDVLGDVRQKCISEGTDKKQCGLSFDAVKRNNKQLSFLIDNLLEVARIQSGTFSLDVTEFNVRELVLQVVDDLLFSATQKGLKIYYSVDKNLSLNADKSRVVEILNNIVNNAIKFTKKGKVMIRVKKEVKFVSISVEDSGIGIKKEDMSNLFKRFFQVKHGLKKGRDTGSGLGLTIVNQLAQLHGGKVFVKSQFGVGTTFTIKLPLKGRVVKNKVVKRVVVKKVAPIKKTLRVPLKKVASMKGGID